MLDAVILDLGGVLVDWDPGLAYPELSREEFERFTERTDFFARNLRADAGQTWETLANELAAAGGDPRDCSLLAQYPQRFDRTISGPRPGMRELIARWRAGGLSVFGLTNWSAQTYPIGAGKVADIAALDDVVVSGQEGLIKPDPRIYHRAIERFGLIPARALFVDDREENVLAAREVGLHGHVYTSTSGLRRAAERYQSAP